MKKTQKSKKDTKRNAPASSLEIVREVYPNALTMNETFDRVYDILKKEYKLKPDQIMRADCTCADDVNTIQEPENVRKMYGPFKMGGLDGFPFTGVVGMGAFSHHVPEDGALFIYYAPHIGIGKDKKIGKILRVGQKEISSSCGAAVAALDNLVNDKILPGNISQLDFQFNTIEQIFLAARTRIIKASGKLEGEKATGARLREATEVMYEAIDERINLHYDKTRFDPRYCKYLILMGGILINGDGYESFNDCRRFEVFDIVEGKSQSFLVEFKPEAK